MAMPETIDRTHAGAGQPGALHGRNSVQVTVADPSALSASERMFVLGEATWLLMHAKHQQHYALFQLAALVLTPIKLDQFRIYRGAKGPVGFVAWAWMSDEASDDYAHDRRLLTPDDIHSGPDLWLIEMVAPFGHLPAIARDLRDRVFPGKIGRSMSRSDCGPPRVVTWDNRRTQRAT